MSHQADLTDSCKIGPAPRDDGAGAPGGASQGRSPARGIACVTSGRALETVSSHLCCQEFYVQI